MKYSLVIALFTVNLFANDSSAVSAAHHGHDAHAKVEGVAPDKALTWLKNGNTRFLKNALRKDGKSQADRDRLSKGQKPHTIILSCADSRVPPELLFDQALGELFVVRVAGQALDSSVIASMEYAVEHLGAQNIVVMGHTECGAVKASIQTPEGKTAGSPSLDKLVADIKPRLSSGRAPASEMSPHLAVESGKNADQIVKDLPARSEIFKKRLSEHSIKITPALYDIKTGKVEFRE